MQVVLDGVTVSNGLEWSPDGRLAYYNDTETYCIDVFDYEPGVGPDQSPPVRRDRPDDGRPDGLTVDAEGGVWVAISGAGVVRRYSPDGALDAEVEVPARKVTACTFGGAGLDQLFITTSRDGLEPGDDPLAGSLFRARPGISGLPVREFAG